MRIAACAAVATCERNDAPAEGGGPDATVEMLRTLLIGLGLSESRSPEHEGFSITIESPYETSVQFEELDRGSDSARRERRQRHSAALLDVCRALSESRFTLTLFLSPRSRTLYVTTNEPEHNRPT